MYIIFEGLDKTGKTTLYYALNKHLKWKYVMTDRSSAGWLAYDVLYSRATPERTAEYAKICRGLQKYGDYLVIYCYTNWNKVKERLAEAGEKCDYDYKYGQEVYKDFIEQCYDPKKVLFLDTTDISIEESVDKICRKIAEMEQGE